MGNVAFVLMLMFSVSRQETITVPFTYNSKEACLSALEEAKKKTNIRIDGFCVPVDATQPIYRR